MARERMVTRTVNVSEVDVMTVNTVTAEVRTITVEIGGGLTLEKDIMKAVKKTHETSTVKCVAITSVKQKEILYGMPESDFIKLAKILPPRSKNTDED